MNGVVWARNKLMSPRLRIHLLGAMALAVACSLNWAAHAQLGSINNPPPQNLFRFDDKPKLRDNGLGTMAERRRELERSKARRPAHRTPSSR